MCCTHTTRHVDELLHPAANRGTETDAETLLSRDKEWQAASTSLHSDHQGAHSLPRPGKYLQPAPKSMHFFDIRSHFVLIHLDRSAAAGL